MPALATTPTLRTHNTHLHTGRLLAPPQYSRHAQAKYLILLAEFLEADDILLMSLTSISTGAPDMFQLPTGTAPLKY